MAIAVTVTAVNEGPTFTTGAGTGKVTTNVSSFWDGACATLIQPDGKIVVAGSMQQRLDVEPYVARYNADGTLDTSFGRPAPASSPSRSSASNMTGRRVALQADGKILVAGYAHNGSNNDFALVRYNTDGSLDTTFDGDGKVTTDIAGGRRHCARNRRAGRRQDPRGGRTPRSPATTTSPLVRYNADGSLDTTFDSDGKVTTAIGAGAR